MGRKPALLKTIVCKECKSEFYCKDILRNSNREYCSQACSNKNKNVGKKRTEKFKIELSLKFAGESNPFYGKQHSNATKLAISKKNKWSEEDFKYCTFSGRQHQIFDGIMLSDGHLEASPTSTRISCGFKFKETLLNIKDEFDSLHFSNPWKSKEECYHFKSSYYRNLSIERKRWYPSGKKIVPTDIRITPLSCQWWFIGDGYQVDYGVKLCTDSFDKQSTSLLIKRLSTEGFNCHITSKNRILIESKHSQEFLRWTMNASVVPGQYLYKWSKHRKQRKEHV